MVLYLSVPMHGMPNKNLELARMMEAVVTALGEAVVVPHEVTPIEHEGPCPDGYSVSEGHSSACHLRADIAVMLLKCDAILMGPGWHLSRGCMLEMQVATSCGLDIYFFDATSGVIRDIEGIEWETFPVY